MLIGSFSNSANAGRARFEITQDASTLLMSSTFVGPDIATITAANYKTLCSAAATALNGKITVTYQGPNSKNIVLISGRAFSDIFELCGGLGGGVSIMSNGGTAYTAYYRIPISLNGTLALSQSAKLVVEFEGFTIYTVGAQNNADATHTIETMATSTYSGSVAVIEALSINASANMAFNCAAHTGIWVPNGTIALDKLTLLSTAGITAEYRGDFLHAVAAVLKRPAFTNVGNDVYLNNWLLLDIGTYVKGTIAITGSSNGYAYLLSNQAVQ